MDAWPLPHHLHGGRALTSQPRATGLEDHPSWGSALAVLWAQPSRTKLVTVVQILRSHIRPCFHSVLALTVKWQAYISNPPTALWVATGIDPFF
jgi:hypothetical protein